MAVITKERTLLGTLSCLSSNFLSYEVYAHYEGIYGDLDIIFEIKPVASENAYIYDSAGGVNGSLTVEKNGTLQFETPSINFATARMQVGVYKELELEGIAFDKYISGSFSVEITEGSTTIGGTAISNCASERKTFSISIYPEVGIFFDGELVLPDAITSLHQEASLFADVFKLGSTLCRTVNMSVLKKYVSSIPENVEIKDINGVTKFTLLVDSVDDTNIDFYDFALVDKMVLLNKNYDFTRLDTSDAQHVLGAICTNILNCSAPSIGYGGDIYINYSADISARDIVSWIAEINGSFARIDGSGNLEFIRFQNALEPNEISVDQCADFKLGEHHLIDRVAIDLGTAFHSYPASSNNNTVYLNPDNQLVSDSGNYTIQGIVEHVHSLINGFEFYSLETTRCPVVQDAIAGDEVVFVYDEESYSTITQINWDYIFGWHGGYCLDLKTDIQEETSFIDSVDKKINAVKILVDRQNGQILQQIAQTTQQLTANITTVSQTANDLTIAVQTNSQNIAGNSKEIDSLKTIVRVQDGGVEISRSDSDAVTTFTNTGMVIKVNDTVVAWAEADGFSAEQLMIGNSNSNKWYMQYANNGATLMFLRRTS